MILAVLDSAAWVAHIVVLAVSIGLLIPILVLLVECVMGSCFGASRVLGVHSLGDHISDGQSDSCETSLPGKDRPTVDVLIPAHNESTVIGRTLASILPQVRSGDRVCVVADNCTDDTAVIARSMGVDVLERFDDTNRAKGFAVAAGLDHLERDSADVVLMVDADCKISEGAIDQLSRQAISFQCPIQANYQMPIAGDTGVWGSVSGFAVRVKNMVRPLGLHRLGFGCALSGSGMAFPKSVARMPVWASDNIVEDMKISYDLALAGFPPRYCPTVVVSAALPEARHDALEQRKRWEHGHLQTMLGQIPRLLFGAIKTMRPGLVVAALDLLIPPLSLLVQLWAMATLVAAIVTAALGLPLTGLIVLLVAGLALFGAIIVAWLAHGRDILSVSELCMVPFYVMTKLPLYIAAIFRPQRAWKRTTRSENEGSACT